MAPTPEPGAGAVALPPGSTGLPLLGEALALARDPFHFFRSRAEEHGAVARTRLLSRDLAILSGPAGAAAWLDEENVQREGGLPAHAADLFGAGVVNQIDGAAHRVRKRHVMRALDREALDAYLPEIRSLLRARLARWRAAGEVGVEAEAALATVELVLANFAGMHEGDAFHERVRRGNAAFAKAMMGLPLAMPGSALARARAFGREIRARFAALADRRLAAPTGDGISRLVTSEVDGERLTRDDVAKEMQHLLFGATGMQALLALATRVLAEDPALADRLRSATAALPADPGADEYAGVPALAGFVMEVKRVGLVIPMTPLGVARRDFEVEGRVVPRGWLVTWAVYPSHRSPGLAAYTDAERFDPERFSPGRMEHAAPHAFAPQGLGEPLASHRCGGVEYSTLVLQAYVVELLRGPRFTLPEQDLTFDTSRMPARHRGGLRVRFEAG